ncbi:MAG: hypothetical protein QM736_02575 [Vicinamibacterales bacterium]
MIVVEHTHWPLVVVGTVPALDGTRNDAPTNTAHLWLSSDVRLAVVIRGHRDGAQSAEAEVFAWLRAHRARLSRCVSRVAWIVEDDALRASVQLWLGLIGDCLFRADAMTFCTVRSAIAWLTCDAVAESPTNPVTEMSRASECQA